MQKSLWKTSYSFNFSKMLHARKPRLKWSVEVAIEQVCDAIKQRAQRIYHKSNSHAWGLPVKSYPRGPSAKTFCESGGRGLNVSVKLNSDGCGGFLMTA